MSTKIQLNSIVINEICVQLANELKNILTKERRKKSRRWWVRGWILRRNKWGASAHMLKELASEDRETYRNHLRMNEGKFQMVLQKIAPKIQKKDTHMREALTAEIKLHITLRYLASGDCFSSLAALYRVPKSSISQFIPGVCDAIYEVLQDFIKVPKTEDEWRTIQEEFYMRWNFPNCLGAIDGKHVLIRCPPKTGSEYFNYKHSFSIILLAVVDANYCFTYIDVGTNGRVNDARVFSKSSFYTALQDKTLEVPLNGIFVADDAFPLRPDLLKPYTRSGPLTECQQVFNYRLSRARRIVENAFGILTSRFKIYEKPIPLATSTISKVVKCTCALHNWLRKTSDVDVEDFFNTGSLHTVHKEGIIRLSNNFSSNNHSKAVGAVSDAYAEAFMTTEAVPWQLTMICEHV